MIYILDALKGVPVGTVAAVRNDSADLTNQQAFINEGSRIVHNQETVQTPSGDELMRADNFKFVDGVVEYDTQAVAEREKEESRQQYKAEYQEAIFNCEVEVDGMVFQTRDTDALKIQFAISTNTDEFRLKNNSVVSVTIEQLNEVYALGMANIKVINDIYNTKLKALQS